ncbi:MAG TPA: adenylate/guanylate cyclase domain-containing protein [Candidatus Methylomirabilis sp.]|nr:adenylate/guanylate cyclase domain-containing protein [Candidatus Methylomirabilis sp.]
MTTPTVERKLAAIFSADVKGYSRLMGEDEVATVQTLTAYRDAMASLIQQHRGRVVDAPGDNVLAEFASVVDAVSCAAEVQRELKSRNAEVPVSRRLEFRIGINLGDVIVDGERIYGDGVNIAARIEGLADAGGIAISGTVYDQVKGKLPLGYQALGEHVVKNIAEPIRVYRVTLDAASPRPARVVRATASPFRRRTAVLVGVVALVLVAGAAVWSLSLRPRAAALTLPDKPSIAVLPFQNMSGDPGQEYFSDGMTEDLITQLSKHSGLFVIARNSVFTYKGKAVKPAQVSRELGVRYVLEGSVRKAGKRVRINAQLIDATTGYHVWAERYDRDLNDVFDLQDEVIEKIVTMLAVTLNVPEVSTSREQGQEHMAREGRQSADVIGSSGALRPVTRPSVVARRMPTRNLDAYDDVLRGMEYQRRTTPEANAEARRLFERAAELDPEYAGAYEHLGWTYLQAWQLQWSRDPATLQRAFDLANQAVALDDSRASCHTLLSQVLLWKKEHARAISEAGRAVALAPNDADGYETLAEVLAWSGKAEEAIGHIKHAMRLNPQYPFYYLWTLGHAYYLTERNADAIATLGTLTEQNPNFLPAHAYLAVLYTEQGLDKKASAEWAAAIKLGPHVSLDTVRANLPYQNERDLERLVSALRKAGVQ